MAVVVATCSQNFVYKPSQLVVSSLIGVKGTKFGIKVSIVVAMVSSVITLSTLRIVQA